MKRKAFTIIELLITMVIMGTLSATLIPRIGGAREETKNTMSKVDKSRELASYVGFDGYTFSSDSAWGGAAWDWFVCTENWVFHHWTDITVCRDWNSITMQDRNLWATKAGTWCSSADTWACGYHYQWWNNYWFANPWVNGEDNITSSAIAGTISTEWYWPWNYFSWSIFRKITSSPYDWSNPKNDNLRWWENDNWANNRWYDTGTNAVIGAENRRWPCDPWYHVPSDGERWTLLQYWAGNYTWAWNSLTLQWTAPLYYFKDSTAKTQFLSDFLIPFAGRRDNDDANVYNVGSSARLWSSSLHVSLARYLYIYSSNVYVYSASSRAYGLSVRCFKD